MMTGCKSITAALGFGVVIAALLLLPVVLAGNQALAQVEGRTVEQPSPTGGNVPGDALGATSDTEMFG